MGVPWSTGASDEFLTSCRREASLASWRFRPWSVERCLSSNSAVSFEWNKLWRRVVNARKGAGSKLTHAVNQTVALWFITEHCVRDAYQKLYSFSSYQGRDGNVWYDFFRVQPYEYQSSFKHYFLLMQKFRREKKTTQVKMRSILFLVNETKNGKWMYYLFTKVWMASGCITLQLGTWSFCVLTSLIGRKVHFALLRLPQGRAQTWQDSLVTERVDLQGLVIQKPFQVSLLSPFVSHIECGCVVEGCARGRLYR